MTRRTILSLLIAPLSLLAGGLLALPAVASGATQWVALAGSVGANTSCASPGYIGVPGVQDAIDNAAPTGDTVHLCPGTWSGAGFGIIDKSLTVEGSGQAETIIDGNARQDVPAFFVDTNAVPSTSLTLRGLTIQNAVTTNFASSAVFADGGLTIEDVTITDSGGPGGVISMSNGTNGFLAISRSTITGQETPVGNPGQYGLIFSVARTTVEDSTIADSVGGIVGGLTVANSLSRPDFEFTVDSSTFTNLSGCVSAIGLISAGVVTITNSTITGNQAGRGTCEASAHIFTGGGLAMRNSTFANNTGPDGGPPPGSSELLGTGDLTLGNNLILGDPDAGQSCLTGESGAFINQGGNVISDDTNGCDDFVGGPAPSLSAKVPTASIALGPLALNVPGLTETMALGAGSVARGAAIPANCPATDQRGVARAVGSCDAGAFQAPAGTKLRLSVKAPKKVKAGKSFRMTVKTTSPTAATRVKTCARLPKGFRVVKRSGGKVKGSTLCWTRSSIAAGKSATYKPTIRTPKGKTGTVKIGVTASGSTASSGKATGSASKKIKIVR